MLSSEESSATDSLHREQYQSLYRALKLLLGIVKDGVKNEDSKADPEKDDDTASASIVKDFSDNVSANEESVIKDVVLERNVGDCEKPSALTDMIYLMTVCANLCKLDTLDLPATQFLDSVAVLVLLWIGEYVENIESAQLSLILESLPVFLDYLLKVLNQKVSKLRCPKSGTDSDSGTNPSETFHALLPCEVIILVLEAMTKESSSESKPEVVNAWEDLLDSRGYEITAANSILLKTLKEYKDNMKVIGNVDKNEQEVSENECNPKVTVSKIHELLHCNGFAKDSSLLPKLREVYREILRNQKVPEAVLAEVEMTKGESVTNSTTENSYQKSKLRLKHQLKSLTNAPEQFEFEPFAMFSEKSSNKFKYFNLTYLLNKNFPRLILSFYNKESCFDKLDVSFQQLVPSETTGVFNALVFDWSKAKENVENLRKVVDLIKYVKSAVNLTIRSSSHCLVLSEDLIKAIVECIAASLVFALSEIIATAASAKRESFREDNSTVVQELIPNIVDLIQSVSLVNNQQNSSLQHLATAMIGWLHVSFLHGLSKSQYSMATERQSSSRSAKRNYSRSYSFRSGSPGILTHAILSIVEQSYKALSKITQFAPMYVDRGKQTSSLANNNCAVFINAVFTQINTTSLSFWLLNVLLKKAISLNPLKLAQSTKPTSSEKNNLESDFLEEVEFHPYLSQLNRREIKIGKTTFAGGESNNSAHTTVSGQASSETLNAGPATSSAEVQSGNANAETNEASNVEVTDSNAANNEQNQAQIYNALPMDSETDNSSTTGGNSLFEEAMLDEDADDDDYTEEDEEDEDEDEDHDEDDQDEEDVDEEEMVIEAQEGEEDVEWIDHAAIIELINETEGAGQNSTMADGSLAAAAQQQAENNLIVMGTTLVQQNSNIAEQTNEPTEDQNEDQDEEDSFLATLEGSGNEAILKLLFQDENNGCGGDVATKEQNEETKVDETGLAEWQKMTTYLRSCRLIVKLLLDNAFTPENMLNRNMKEFFSSNQSSILASILRELESMQLDVYSGLPLPHSLESFKKLTYQLVHAFISSEFCDTLENKCSFLRDLGFKWDSQETGSTWPLAVPLPWLSLLAQVILFAEENSSIIIQIWKRVIETIVSKIKSTNVATLTSQISKIETEKDVANSSSNLSNSPEDLSPYQLQLLQFAFYELNTVEKTQLVKCICESIQEISDCSESEFSANQLYISRLCLILEFMLNHFSNAPANLAEQVEGNLFEASVSKIATDTCVSVFLESGILNTRMNTTNSPGTEGVELEILQKKFYDINGASNAANAPASGTPLRLPRVCKEGLKALMSCGVDYNQFYDCLLKVIKLPTVEKNANVTECLSSAYLFGIMLRVCSLLPPSIQFMTELSNPVSLESLKSNLVHPMIQIMWTARLSSEFYAPFVSHALEQNHPESKDVVAAFQDGKLLFSKMLQILEQGLALLDCSKEESELPSSEKLLLLDMTASRLHCELEAQSEKSNFDLEKIAIAIPLVDKLLEKVYELSRTYIIEQLKKSKEEANLDSLEVYSCIIQSDFQVSPFKTILKTCNFFEKSSNSCEDFVELLHKNGESHLKETILQWKAALGLSTIWDMKNGQSNSVNFKNYPIPSEMRGMHVLSAHIRCLMIEGQNVLLSLQHTMMSSLNLFRDLIGWAPVECLNDAMISAMCTRCLSILNHETCDAKESLAKSLDDFSEKVFKKASDRCPTGNAIASLKLNNKQTPIIPAIVLRRVLSVLHDLARFSSSSNTSFSVPLMNQCLQQLEVSLFSTNVLISSATIEMFSSKERQLFDTLSLLSNQNLHPETINILLNFLYRIANEMLGQKSAMESTEQLSVDADMSPSVASLLSKAQLGTILETLFTKQLDYSKNVAFYDDKETFILIQNMSKLLVDRGSSNLPPNFVSTLLISLIELSRSIVHSRKQPEKFEKLMKLMLILANYNNGAGHVSLFKASLEFVSLCTNNSTEILQSLESTLNDAENDELAFPNADGTNPSNTAGQVQMFNVIFIYVAEMLLQLSNKRVDDEDFSMSDTGNFVLQFDAAVATDSGDSRDVNSQLSAEITSEVDLEVLRSGLVKKGNSGEDMGAVASGESVGPKLCTYTVTQKEFMNQHWYHCYSCSMHDSVGVCSVCAKLCHKRHDVTYAKFGSFYCDCGARGERYCKALSKASIEKHLKESQNSRHFESLTFESGLDKFNVDSGVPTKDDIVKGLLNDAAMLSQNAKLRAGKTKSCPKVISDVFKPQLLEIAMSSNVHNVVQLMLNLRTSIQKHLYNTSPSNSSKRLEKCFDKLHDAELKFVNIVTNLVSLTARSVESTFENVKMSFSGEHGATMRQLITAHMIRRTAMCVVPPKLVNTNPQSSQNTFPILIVAHDKGLLTCVDTANLLRQSDSVNGKKLNIDRLATSTVPLTILSICSNSSYPEYLAVTGIKDCHVLVYNSADCSISSQLSLNLSLDAGNFIIKALWIPGSQTQLAIITADFIKIYDLAYDLQNPIYFYHLLSGKLRDVTFLIDGATNTVNLLIMSSQGFIYTQVLDDQSRAENGPFYVTNNIVLESNELKMSNGQFGSGGLSIYYSHTMQMLFFSFSNAKSFACSLKKLEELPTSTVLNKIQLLTNTSAFCHWKEIEDHAGVILASDEKSGTVSFICMCPDSFQMQEVSLTPARCKTLDVIGVRTSNENGLKSTSIVILADDGGLKVFTVNSTEKTASFWISSTFNPSIDDFTAASHRKKMKPTSLKIKQQVASSTSVSGVEFPIDYFENCQALDDVEFGGNDYLQVYNRKQMKNRLKYANQYLAASKSTPIIMDITNENSSMLISGLRVQVGCTQSSGTSPDRAPTFLEIFGRQVQLEPLNSSRWVDLPFTTEECLLSEKSVSLTIGNSRDPSGITIVDSVKVYGKPKSHFVSVSSESNEAVSSGSVSDGRSGIGILKSDECGDLFGLRSLDGETESYATQSFETAFDTFISTCLEILSLHFNMSDIDPKARSAKEAKELASYLTSCPLPVSISIQNKNLLFSIFKSKEKLYSHVDEISLNCVARALQSENLSPETFERHLQMIKHISQNRPRNLIKFSAQMAVSRDCADEHDGEKISNLVEDVMSKFWSVVEDRCNVKLLVPLVNQTRVKNEILVSAVVEILFTFGIQDSDLMPHMMTHLVSLLLYHDPTISFVAKSALNRLTRPHKPANQIMPPRNVPTKSIATSSNEQQKVNPEPIRSEPLRRTTEAVPEQNPVPSGSISASVRVSASLREHLLQNMNAPSNPGALDNRNEPPAVPHNELDGLLNVAPLLEIPNDADDEAMMELAIALSLQDQPGTSNNTAPAITGSVVFETHTSENPGNEAQSVGLSTAAVGSLDEPMGNLSIEPHVEFVETPDVSNLQGDSTDETGSAVGTDDEEEESLAATDGSALPVENMSAQAAGSGAASEDGNSLAGESIQTTASASSSAYGGEEPVNSNSQCSSTGAKNTVNAAATHLGSTETMNLNTSFVMEENSTCKLADSRTEMLKLMMNYLPQVCNVGGIRAVPFLQVFLSLSLEIENEQVIALVLEKVISQLKLKVDPTIFSRNFSKEVQVLLLRLLSMYMQKTSKADEVSALARMTANALNDKGIIEFCRLVVSEMLPYWRNSFVHVELERSLKLLRAQPVQSPPDMHPFFLASYVIGHQADVFEAYHQLLTEVTLRIPYQAYRLLEIEVHADIKKDWVNCLSQYMILPSQYVRHQVRKLLQFICGTKEAYRLQRDLYVFRHHFDAIQTIFDNSQKNLKKQSGSEANSRCIKNESAFLESDINSGVDKLELSVSSNFVSLDYSALITVVEHLKQVLETAVGRCFSWFTFCETRPSVVAFLMKLASITTEAIHPYILELVILATCGSKAAVLIKTNSGVVDRPKKQIVMSSNKNAEKSTNGEEDTSSSPECTEETCQEFADELVSTFIPSKDWKLFLSTFFLECSSPSMRWQIHGLVRSLWKSISAESQFKLVKVLWDIWNEAASFGKRASQLVDILGFVTLKSNVDPKTLQVFGEKLVALLQEQNERLQNHPNFFLYEKLLHAVEFDGFYLENDPCIVCHSKENSSVLTKLSSIKADSRFTTTTQIIKLTSPYQINSIVCRITDINNSKMVKSMAIYYNKRTVASVVELKNNPQVWHRARKVTLEAGQSEVKIDFTLPVVATNLMMEVCDFYENFHATSESLQCPRCSSSVMANPGICGNCGENVFQCHKCRQINYDEKDPFLCSSCGFCKYAKFDFTLNAKPCLAAVDPIENQDDRKRAISALNGLLETADSLTKSVQSQHPYLEDLFHRLDAGECVTNIYSLGSAEMRNINLHTSGMSINSPVGHGSSTLIHKVIQNIAMKYYECKMSFEELSIVSDKIIATRGELFDYDRKNNLITVYSDAFCCSDKQRRENDEDDNGLEFGQLRKKSDQLSTKRCFGCLVHSAIHSIYLLKAFATSPVVKPLISSTLLNTLLIGPNMRNVCGKVQSLANGLIMTVCRNDEANTKFFCQTLMKSIKDVVRSSSSTISPQFVSTKALHDQVSLLVSYIDLKDSCWNIRLQTVTQLLLFGVQCNNAAIITHIVLPCMKSILNLIQTPSTTSQAAKRKDGHVDINDWFLGKEVFETWSNSASERTDKEKSVGQELSSNSWIRATLFHPGSKIVRQVACQILESLACHDERRCEIVLMLIMQFIEDSCCSLQSNQDLADLMSLVQKLACKDDRKVILSRHGVPKRIAELILSEIGHFTDKEKEHGHLASKGGNSNRGAIGGVSASWSHDLCQGVRLRCLSELLSGLLEVNEILNHWKAQLIQPILHGYLAAKKLVSQRTKAIDEAQDVLLEMLDLMTTGTVEETAEFMKICVLTLQQFPTDDQLTPVFVFERLCNLIHPEQADTSPEFALCLEKDPQQEDFLSGRMQGNPYNSSEPGMGPLMRDVKNKICRDCELVALLEDDNGMELLVNNRIISLSLPVAEVYQKVWLATERGGDPQNEGEPMRVVYRMRGLMGDATEEFIENLNARSASGAESSGDENSSMEEEEKYKLAAVLAECNGFHVMLNSLNSISDVFASKHLMYVLLKLFSYCVKLRRNRIALVSREYDTLKVFLKLLQLVLNMPETAAPANSSATASSFRPTNNEASATRNELVEKVLMVMQPILQETQNIRSLEISGNLEQLDQILSCMNISHVQQNPLLLHHLMTIVPYLSFGDNSQTKMIRIIEFFKPFIDFEKYNEDKLTSPDVAVKTELFIDCFIAMVESIPASDDGNQLKSLITKCGVLSNCTNYVLNLTPGKEYLADQKAWKEYLARPAVPYVLKMMRALSKSHEENQIALSKGCIPVLHRLERVASEEQVGTLAENLLETLKENMKVSEIITGARKQTREEKKRLAMAMRAKQLETLGLEATSGGRVVKTSSSHNVNKFEDLAEETGAICCICREGYKYHPKSVMGIYVFAKKHVIEHFEQAVRIETSQRSGDGGVPSMSIVPRGPMTAKAQGYATVTSFNTVHYDCHNNAVRSHRGRDEWESATLQNADVKCNGILPMWGAQVSESHFANSLARYNTHLQESTGLREPTYNTTVHDCKLLLLKFAEEKSFSEDCGGGARQSNAKLIPYLLNIALYVLNSTRNAPREELLVNQFIQDPVDKWARNSFEAEGAHFYALMQLLVMNQKSFWAENSIHFLQRLIVCVHVRSSVQQPMHNNPTIVQITEKGYKVYKPALLYFTLINSLSKALEKVSGKPGRSWSEEVMEYLKMNDASLLESLEKNFLGAFEEALTAESFAEWCDIVGLLPQIGPENVDQFMAKTLQKINPEVN